MGGTFSHQNPQPPPGPKQGEASTLVGLAETKLQSGLGRKGVENL